MNEPARLVEPERLAVVGGDAPGPVEVSVGTVSGAPAPGDTTVGAVALSQWRGRRQARGAGTGVLAARPATVAIDVTAILFGVLVALRGELPLSGVEALLFVAAYPVAVMSLLTRPTAHWDDGSAIDELRRVVTAVVLPALVLIGVDAVIRGDADVALGLRLAVCSLALLVVGRAVRRYVCASDPLATSRPLLIVGAGKVGAELARRLREMPYHGLRPVGFLDYEPPAGGADPSVVRTGVPLLGAPGSLPIAVARTGAECVAFALTSDSDERLLPLIEECERLGVHAFFIPRLFEATGWRAQVRSVGSLPLVELHAVAPRDLRFTLKHLIDRVAAALLLVLLAPLLVAIAGLVKLDLGGTGVLPPATHRT